jgi:hypothetical protein
VEPGAVSERDPAAADEGAAADAADAAEARLAAAAPRFELAALLRVLIARGHSWETISFEGVRELTGTPGLVHALRFAGRTPRRAVVRLNLGLLGPNGALPSYFQRFAEELRDPRPFLSFIRFFDDVLLRNHAWLTCPGEGIAASGALRAAYRTTAGFASAPRLHWLFRAIVPELPVTVTPTAFVDDHPDAGARFGPAQLDGTAVMGPAYRVTRRGFIVRLHAEEETDESGRSWESELTRRWEERIAPLLGRLRGPLQLRVCFERYRQGAMLAPTAQMGNRRLRTREAEAWEVVLAGPRR